MVVTLADLVAALPVALPAGRLVVPQAGGRPVYWLSEGTVGADLVAALRVRAAATGLQPLLLNGLSGPADGRPWAVGEVYPARMSPPGEHDAGVLLAHWWRQAAPEDDDTILAPFGAEWPGLAPPGSGGGDPERAAGDLAAVLLAEPLRLGLVAAGSGADALAAAGWSGPTNHASDTGRLAAVLRSWQGRFGVRVVGAGFDTLQLSVGAPPVTPEHALRVAVEHFAFCPDLVHQGTGSLTEYAEELTGATTWWFWWD